MLEDPARFCAVLAAALVIDAASVPAAPLAGGYHQRGRLTWSGELAASFSPEDDAFFNDTGYSSNPLRRATLALRASLEIARPLTLLAEARTENFDSIRVYALYLRVRPLADHELDLQVGLVPPVFGAFGRRPYGSGNPLIGYPLAYQYLTTLRTDAVPRTADGLLAVRGRGWLVAYPVGNPYPGPGLPLVDSQQWDVGAQVSWGKAPLQLAVAVTQGTLCEPRLEDDNDRKQVSARVRAEPAVGLVFGVSAAAGDYTDRSLDEALPPEEAQRVLAQESLGADAEYSRGHGMVRLEAVYSRFDLPRLEAPYIEDPVESLGTSVEATYRFLPGIDLAARFDRLWFSTVTGSRREDSWDAPVTRLEAGLAYTWRRGIQVKGVYQYNWRSAGPRGRHGLPAIQAIWQF
jgi:hypothetical protein